MEGLVVLPPTLCPHSSLACMQLEMGPNHFQAQIRRACACIQTWWRLMYMASRVVVIGIVIVIVIVVVAIVGHVPWSDATACSKGLGSSGVAMHAGGATRRGKLRETMGDISAPTIGSRPLQLAIVALAASASQQCAMSATSGQHVRRQHLVRLRKYLHGARLGAETILEMAG